MSTRDEERNWLATSKAWQGERDAVGLDRLVDLMQLIDASGSMRTIDLRRWVRTAPQIAQRLRDTRQVVNETNRLVMEWIQQQTDAAKVER